MIQLIDEGVFLTPEGKRISQKQNSMTDDVKNTMTYQILKSHNQSASMENLSLKFDALVSPDNNYVSILQTVSACGLKKFPIPYVLSNCHNTLCAVGGTMNEDDHLFGLDCAKKYGGIFVPPYKAVLHQYMRETMAGCGKMILGSDSHTRYGVLGTLAIGEGGGEIAKQLLAQTYDINRPQVIAVCLKGCPSPGVGPQDVALTIIGTTFKNGFNKNKILEFVGEGIQNLSVEYRMGIDVMMTESAALSSIWCTDEKVCDYLGLHGRETDYYGMRPRGNAYYDGMIEIELSEIECMMALPSHPSNVITIREFIKNQERYIQDMEETVGFSLDNRLKDGKFHIDQALVSGCCGGLFENIAAMADILDGTMICGDCSSLGINPASQPIFAELSRNGIINRLISAGATIRPSICGPCFGVTDVPANQQISIRHVTRNYPNREGAKAGKGQKAASILMDARSIAATVRCGGLITPATELTISYQKYDYQYDTAYYKKQVYHNFEHGNPSVTVRKGPNIVDWPTIDGVNQHLLVMIAGAYKEPVTTDDLSPSGDAVAYRSNPPKLAEFTMINRDSDYVGMAKTIAEQEAFRKAGESTQFAMRVSHVCKKIGCKEEDITIGSAIAGVQIGDGSSREQAASSQKILGGYANIAVDFATKRYRSNLINWGILPIISKDAAILEKGQILLVKNIHQVVEQAGKDFEIQILDTDQYIMGNIGKMTMEEKEILLSGCLINYNRQHTERYSKVE